MLLSNPVGQRCRSSVPRFGGCSPLLLVISDGIRFSAGTIGKFTFQTGIFLSICSGGILMNGRRLIDTFGLLKGWGSFVSLLYA